MFTRAELVALARRAPRGVRRRLRVTRGESEGTGLHDAVREAIGSAAAGTWVQIRHLESTSDRMMQGAVTLIDSASNDERAGERQVSSR